MCWLNHQQRWSLSNLQTSDSRKWLTWTLHRLLEEPVVWLEVSRDQQRRQLCDSSHTHAHTIHQSSVISKVSSDRDAPDIDLHYCVVCVCVCAGVHTDTHRWSLSWQRWSSNFHVCLLVKRRESVTESESSLFSHVWADKKGIWLCFSSLTAV